MDGASLLVEVSHPIQRRRLALTTTVALLAMTTQALPGGKDRWSRNWPEAEDAPMNSVMIVEFAIGEVTCDQASGRLTNPQLGQALIKLAGLGYVVEQQPGSWHRHSSIGTVM